MTDPGDEDNDNTRLPDQDYPRQRESLEPLDEPRTGQQHLSPPSKHPQPPKPEQPPSSANPRPPPPSAGSRAAGFSAGGSQWPPHQPRVPSMFPLPRGRQIMSHPIVLSRSGTPGSSPPAQRPLSHVPLYPLPTRHLPANELPNEAEDDPGSSGLPPRVRRTMPPPGHPPPHPPRPPMPMRLQEGPWRAFAGPRIAARPLRPLHQRTDTAPYDAPGPSRVRHNPYAPAPSPAAPLPPRAVMPPAAYRPLPRQRSGGVLGRPYAPPPPWIDPRVPPPQRALYGLARMPPLAAPLPHQPPATFPGAHHPLHPHARPLSAAHTEARETTTTAAVVPTIGSAMQHAAATIVEQSVESPSGGAADTPGGCGGEGDASTASALSAFPHPDHQHIEVTVAVRVQRATSDASGGSTGTAGGAGTSIAAGTSTRPTSQPEDAQPQPPPQSESRSGYMPGPVRGVFDVPRYLAGRDCIHYNGRWMSRSNFERVGGSKMAKWYRSIRVLPSLEPLGEWLEHQGMPVTKGPARRSSKRTAPDSGDEPWLLGALASRGPAASTAAAATAAASTSEPDEAAVAFPEYNPFTPIARIPVRQSSSSVPVHEAPGNLPQRLLAISPLMSVPARPGQLPLKITATAPAVRPAATTSPRQSLTQPPRRLSGGPTEMGGLYSIPIRRAVPVTGGGATGTECDLTTLTTAGMRKQQQEQQQQRTPEAEVGNLGPNEDEDVATLRWLFRQTGRNASQASAPAAAQPDLPSQPPARKSEAPIAPLKVQMSLRWPAPPAPRPAEAEEAPMAAAEAEPVLLRPTRRQRLLSTRSDEEVLVGVEDVSQRADELLPPPLSRRRPADAEGGGGGTVGASGSGVAPAEPPRRNVALLRTQTDVMRIGGLVSVGAISESGRTLPKKEQDDPAAAVAERALLHPYIHHAPSQKNLPYYQDSRRATTMDPPPSGSRGGGSGGSSSAFSAEAAATTGTPAVQSSALQQRHRYLETPPQLQRQGQLRVQLQFLRPDWERRKEVMQGEEGLWTEEEAEDQQERYHLYEWSQGHVPPPSLTGGQQQQQQQQQQQRYQQHLQQQYQQQPQQEAQRQIEQQQRAELEEYALRHRAMRRRRQQDRGSGDESHDDDAG